jgi:hypothetical protein
MAPFQPGQLVQLAEHPEHVIRYQGTDDEGMAVCCWDDAAGAHQQARYRLAELHLFVRRTLPARRRPPAGQTADLGARTLATPGRSHPSSWRRRAALACTMTS